MQKLLITIVLVFPTFLQAQNQDQKDDYYQRLIIEFFDRPSIEGRYGLIENDSISLRNNFTRQTEYYSLDDVERVKAKVGTRLGSGLMHGFAFGLGLFLGELIVYAVSGEFIQLTRLDFMPRYMLFVGVPTAIGGLIGLAIPDYKTVYRGERPDTNSVIMQITPYSDNHTSGISLRLKF